MDTEQIAVAFHLLGFALGLGGATISDITFFKSLRNRVITGDQFSFLEVLSRVIWVGLGLLIASGLVIFWLIYAEQGNIPMLSSPRWQTKLTLVGVVLVNGLFFKFMIFPALKKLVGQNLSLTNIGPIVGRLAFSGAVSILSWYSIFVVTLLPRTFRPPFLYFIGAYVALVIAGFVAGRIFITRSVR